jgi:hypothetical protein
MQNECMADPSYFENELLFLYDDIKDLQNHSSNFFKSGVPFIGASRREDG